MLFLLAYLAEQLFENPRVLGSIPRPGTTFKPQLTLGLFCTRSLSAVEPRKPWLDWFAQALRVSPRLR